MSGSGNGQQFASPHAVRLAYRANTIEVFPSTVIDGFLCVNIVMMDQQYANEFLEFCKKIRYLVH